MDILYQLPPSRRLLRSIASSLFNLRVGSPFPQPLSRSSLVYLLVCGLVPSTSYSIHFFTHSLSLEDYYGLNFQNSYIFEDSWKSLTFLNFLNCGKLSGTMAGSDSVKNGVGQRYKKGKGSPYSIAERRVLELIPVLGSQRAGDVSHKPCGRLPLLSARPVVTLATLNRTATNFAAW